MASAKKKIFGGTDTVKENQTSYGNFFNLIKDNAKNFFNNLRNDPNLMGCIMKYLGLFMFVIFTAVILYYAIEDPDIFSSKKYVYLFMILVPLILIVFLVMRVGHYTSSLTFFLYLFLLVCAVFILIYMYLNMSQKMVDFIAPFLNMFIVLFILVGLAIIFNIFANNVKRLKGWSGFVAHLMFFIPCLIRDFVQYIMEQFYLASYTTWALIGIEVLIILAYIYVPTWFKSYYESNTYPVVLMNEPKFLNKKNVIARLDDFKDKATLIQYTENRNYSISLWVYINPQSSNYNESYANEGLIFEYGNGTDVKPRITYYNDTSDKRTEPDKNSYKFYLSNSTDADLVLSVPNQKWNNFVITYNSNMVDVFVNGNLERSFDISEKLPGFNIASDIITVGDENGLYGAICNVVFYAKPLNQSEIVTFYNLLMNKNPPVNNL